MTTGVRLTTHVLDTMAGCGAAGLAVALADAQGEVLAEISLDAGGRAELVAADLPPGRYRLRFAAGAYHRAKGLALEDPPFLDVIDVPFGVTGLMPHVHVPLLLNPYGYSVYRGC